MPDNQFIVNTSTQRVELSTPGPQGPVGNAPDASTTEKGIVQLAGDLAGTATSPTVPALANKQPLDSDLTAIAGLSPTNDDVLQRKAGAWTSRSMAQLKTDLAYTAADVGAQPSDADLTAIAGLSPSNDDVIQRKSGAWTNRTMAQLAADVEPHLTAGGGSAEIDVQTFTASGTWTKPAFATATSTVHITLIGGGGGGGSGRRGAAASNRVGGGAGGSGGFTQFTVLAGVLSSTVSVTVGAAGTGGAAQTTDDTSGNPGTAGGDTYLGSSPKYGYAGGGGLGPGGATGANTGGAPGFGQINGTLGGGGTTGTGNSSTANGGTSGGGAGGGVSSADVASNGGQAAVSRGMSDAVGAAGVVGGSTPTTAFDSPTDSPTPGGGGGGGAASITAAAQAGAVGGKYGGGGGGGGASLNGNNSGAGGNGGAGFVQIITIE